MRETSLGSNASVVLKKLTRIWSAAYFSVLRLQAGAWNGYDAFELGLVAPSDGIELRVVCWVRIMKKASSRTGKGIHDVLRTASLAISPARLVRFDVLKTRSLMLW
jgi:hypothetical protein